MSCTWESENKLLYLDDIECWVIFTCEPLLSGGGILLSYASIIIFVVIVFCFWSDGHG